MALATLGVSSASGATVAGSAALAPTRQTVIVTGPDAAAALRAVGARQVRSAGYGSLAVARVSRTEAAAVTARGLHVVPDAPVTLDADSSTTEPSTQPTDGAVAPADPAAPVADPSSTNAGTDPTPPSDAAGSAAPTTDTSSAGTSDQPTESTQAGPSRPGSARTSGTPGQHGDRANRGEHTGRAIGPEPTRRLSVRELLALPNWQGRGGTGAGVTVAVIDSGVDEVPGLAGRVIHGANFTDEGSADRYGHGTFDAGLIAGDGTGDDGSDTGIAGVAPQARIISVKVADSHGRSTIGRVALGLAWVISHRSAYGIDIANLSMSTAVPMSYDVNPLNALAEAAWFSGVTVLVSSGNGGQNTVSSAPANDPFVITVGSIYDHNTRSKYDDTISPYTNIGTTVDGFEKPEILTPGQHVQSTLPAGSVLAKLQTVTGLPAGYGQMSGTSMATAVASGLAGLLVEARPGLNPDQVKGAFASSLTKHNEPTLRHALSRAGRFTANSGVRPSMALAAAYAQLFAHTTDYSSIDWNALDWRDVAWDQATWTHVDWTSATWSSATWSEATWGSATWASLTWATATWATASWTSASWTDASWADASWSSASWADASWATASWADAAPSAG
jgi:serine protease AprX